MSDGAASASGGPTPKKRKRQIKVKFDAASPPSSDKSSKRPKIVADPVTDLLNVIVNAKDRKGHVYSTDLMELPSKKQDPDYHKLVQEPIDIKTIQQRVTDGCTYDDLVYDLNLMLTNTRMYYDLHNTKWTDACELTKIVNTHAMHHSLNTLFVLPRINWKPLSKGEATGSAALREQTAKLITAVKTYVKEDEAGDGYLIHEIFLKVPAKKDYPDYYKIVNDPIDIATIEKMAGDGKFPGLAEFIRTFDAMFQNAVTYNPPGSEVYEDALALMKYLRGQAYMMDKSLRGTLESRQEPKQAGSLKVSVKRMTPSPGGGPSPGAGEIGTVKVSLKRKKGAEDDGDAASENSDAIRDGKKRKEDSVVIDLSDVPMYEKPAGIRSTLKHVFNIIKDADNGIGNNTTMSDVFWILPTEDELPDYYTKIARPIEMKSINGKILGNTYRHTSEFQKAVNLMCDNAMLYNADESHEFKAAAKLKALCAEELRKAEELGIPLTESQRAKMARKTDRLARKVEKDKERQSRGDSKSRRGKDKKVTKVDMYLSLLRVLKDAEANDGSGRKLALAFKSLPSREDYPEYYEIIKRPVDLKTIEERISKHRYSSAEDLMKDINTMFSNAHSFNEEGSVVYQDATELKALAHTQYLKLLEMMQLEKGGAQYSGPGTTHDSLTQQGFGSGKRRQLKSIKADPTSMCKGILSTLERSASSDAIFGSKGKAKLAMFDELPPRKENPAYYRVITTPIDLSTIRGRVEDGIYTNASHIVLDLVLLFNNARVYHDRGSPMYNAANGLMRALRQAAAQVLTNQDAMAISTLDESCPLYDVADELLVALETSPHASHFLEVPDRRVNRDFYTKTPNALTLKDLRGKVLSKRYQFLHEFVSDVGSVMSDARKRSVKGDAVYSDSIALQEFFAERLQALLAERNITSPGCADYTKDQIPAIVAQEEKAASSVADAGEKDSEEALASSGDYTTGEFAYVKVEGGLASICLIRRMFRRADGVEMFEGTRYLRPAETYHVETRTFYENEVFKTNDTITEPVAQLGGKCWVLFMRDFCTYTVAGISAADLYCCESRYVKNGKKMEKIRNFTVEGLSPELVPRDMKLDARKLEKVKSQFGAAAGDNTEPADGSSGDASEYPKPVLDDPRNVIQPLDLEKGCTYYKSLCLDNEVFSIGDAILLRNPDDKKKALPFVALIKRIWVDSKGFPYCSGPWLARPIETHHDPAKLFYKNELLLTSSSDSNSMLSIIRKCAIMQASDYQSWRPLSIAEPYVFICESRYNESKKEIAVMKSYPDDMNEPEERLALVAPADLTKEPSPFAKGQTEHGGSDADVVVGDYMSGDGEGGSQAVKNLKSQLGMTRSALNDTRKKSKKLLDRAIQQAARLAALEAGGDGTEAASIKFSSLKNSPPKLDPKNEYIAENIARAKAEQPLADERTIRDKLSKLWITLMPADKAPYIQKAAHKDEIVAAAYAAALTERDSYQPPTASTKPTAAQQHDTGVNSAMATFALASGSGTVATSMASTALATEQQRNPNGYAMSQAYELRIAAEIKAIKNAKPTPRGKKLSRDEQRELLDATIPAPAVATTSITDALAHFKSALTGDNVALQRVFAGW